MKSQYRVIAVSYVIIVFDFNNLWPK